MTNPLWYVFDRYLYEGKHRSISSFDANLTRHSPSILGLFFPLRTHILFINESEMKLTVAALCLGSAAGFTASSFSGSALKATANDSTMLMATGMGVNGFGRIGRLGTLIALSVACHSAFPPNTSNS